MEIPSQHSITHQSTSVKVLVTQAGSLNKELGAYRRPWREPPPLGRRSGRAKGGAFQT